MATSQDAHRRHDRARPALCGLVLAGGRSRRMGRDKALLTYDAEPLVERIAGRLASVCAEVMVASGDGNRLTGLPWRQVADAPGAAGPLAGIVAGLQAAGGPLVAVVAVDMPHASPEVLSHLAGMWRGEVAVAPVVDGVAQPLHAVWATSARDEVARLLEAGERSPLRVLATLDARLVQTGDLPEGSDGRFAANVNRPEDLRRL